MLTLLPSLSLAALAIVSIRYPLQDPVTLIDASTVRHVSVVDAPRLQSASAGMEAALQVLGDWGAGRAFDLLEVESSRIDQGASMPGIGVDLVVRVYGWTSADAEAAFHRLEKAVADYAAKAQQGPVAQVDLSKSALGRGLRTSKAIAQCFDRSHVGTVRMVLPAQDLPRAASLSEQWTEMPAFLRRISVSTKKALGPLAITPGMRAGAGWGEATYSVRCDEKDRTLDKTQVSEFLGLLGTGLRAGTVSSIRFRMTEGEAIEGLHVTLAQRVASDYGE